MVDKTEKSTAMRVISNESCNTSKYFIMRGKNNDSLNEKDIRYS